MRLVRENEKTIVKTDPLEKVTHGRVSIMWTEDGPNKKAIKRFLKTVAKSKRLPGLLCKHCEFFIFSAHRWDMSACQCYEITGGEQYIAIDGGADYCKYTGDVWDRAVAAELDVDTLDVYAEPYKKQPIETADRFKNIVKGD